MIKSKWSDSQDQFEVVVQPRAHRLALPWQDVWANRQLLYFLVWRDLKVRYKQAVIGVGWAVLKPLLLMLVFVTVFGILIRVPTGDVPYSVVVYSGLLPWMFISTVVSTAAASLLSNSPLITKVYFPRIIAPLSSSLVAGVDLLISLPLLLGLLLWFDIPLTERLVWVLPLFIMMFLLALGVGLIMATLQVRYHDIALLLPILLTVWMYASPVIYPIEIVPPHWLWLYSLNPAVGWIQGLRWALVDTAAPTFFMLVTSTLFSLASVLGGVLIFQAAEDTYADLV